MTDAPARPWVRWAIGIAGTALALWVRWRVRQFESLDFMYYTDGWYKTIRSQGLTAFSHGFSDYTPPYLYCLYAVSKLFPWIHPLAATKAPSSVTDFVCAFLVARIVRQARGRDSIWPVVSFVIVLLAPTVAINSALWGQTDSIYTSALLACLYLSILGRTRWAFLAFAISFTFKLQSLFLAPLLLALAVRGDARWRSFVWIPAAYAAAIVPSWALGRPLEELLLIYPSQIDQLHDLLLDAPNLYAWVPVAWTPIAFPLGLVLATGSALTFIVAARRIEGAWSVAEWVRLALLSLVLMPFVLPRMHERYFFAADVVSILYAFLVPNRAFVPVLVGGASFFASTSFLFGRTFVPLAVLPLAMLAVIVTLVLDRPARTV